jgi:hypothetical protein
LGFVQTVASGVGPRVRFVFPRPSSWEQASW